VDAPVSVQSRTPPITRAALRTALRLFVKRQWHRQPSIAQLRALVASGDRWAARFAEVPAARAVDAGGVPAEWIGRAEADGSGVLLFLHGGAFIVHLPNAYRQLAGRLAAATGLPVLLPDYRLAPEHPFPAGLDDCGRVYRWLIERGVPPQRVVVAGDSAGGNLTLALLMRLRDEGLPLPAAAVVMSPVTDLTGGSPSIERNEASDWLFALPALGVVHDAYLGARPAADPRASPLLGEWAGPPPLLFHVSGSPREGRCHTSLN
jgi:monoterpene epsilon-lactone hydrolase